ncbi:unnamed protein product [Spirodela intermedia]|uniref:Peroxidase n=1 Tax=Spirodela intermedia TaxID=51605 RepID=A0A7I8KDK8_SPIIN|nr:unnamed protein product [Spirodela intermedia]
MAPLISAISLLLLLAASSGAMGQGTRVGFYSTTCPRAEAIVRSTVRSHLAADRTLAAGLLRMHFHDCFKTAPPNLSVRGYEVIDDAKTQLEAACPGIVSCADILALAARDSVALTGGPSWGVPTGRRDGTVSSASDVDLPSFTDSVDSQKLQFSQRGLTTKDLVTLVGAHTLGTAQCQFFRYRLFNFTSDGGPDPTIDGEFLTQLRTLCPADGDGTRRVALDSGSEGNFDLSYFNNLRGGRGVLESDQSLFSDASTRRFVQGYTGLLAGLVGTFRVEFGVSMVKMSNIGVKTGNLGEIRRVCSSINS